CGRAESGPRISQVSDRRPQDRRLTRDSQAMKGSKPVSLGPRELARLTSVSTDTLRHYEKRGLLTRAPRTRSGYRRYSADAAARVLLIQRALVVGFSLDELATVLAERGTGGGPGRRG